MIVIDTIDGARTGAAHGTGIRNRMSQVMIDGGQTIHGHPRWYRTDYTNEGHDEWEPVK